MTLAATLVRVLAILTVGVLAAQEWRASSPSARFVGMMILGAALVVSGGES